MNKQYVVATIKKWNIGKMPPGDNWHLITSPSEYETIKRISPRYVFLPHWSWLLPKWLWGEYECVAFHCADLPEGRGSSVIQHKIMAGETHTKLTAFRVDEGIDTGDVYLKRDLCLNGSAEEIYLRMANIIYGEMMPYIVENEPNPIKQTGKGDILKRRTPDMSEIKPCSLQELHNFIRALDADTYPPAFIIMGGLKFEFTRSSMKHDRLLADVAITKTE